jgi:hypothetical protein
MTLRVSYNSHTRVFQKQPSCECTTYSLCVCVCVRVRACVRACVFVCVCRRALALFVTVSAKALQH